MGLMAVGAVVQGVGSIVGGIGRKKAAKKAARQMAAATDAAVAAVDSDQARAIEYRTGDEARLKAASGFDFVKLVADSEAAGFNPLTVLNATGGAGYDGRGAVLTTPFISKSDALFQKAGLMGGAQQAVAQTAGFMGDAVAGLGSNLFNMGMAKTQRAHETDMLMMDHKLRNGGAVNRAVTQSPTKSTRSLTSIFGAEARVPIYEIDGTTSYISARNADALGKRPFDVMTTNDWETLIGGIADVGGASKGVAEGRGAEQDGSFWQIPAWMDLKKIQTTITSPFTGGGGWGDAPPLQISIN